MADGTISTLPLGYAARWPTPAPRCALVRGAVRPGRRPAALAARTGRRVRVACEPEPGCVLETRDDAVRWSTGCRRRRGAPGSPWTAVEAHLGVCFDTCHQAVAVRGPGRQLARARRGGRAGRQDAALERAGPGRARSPEGLAARARFDEPRFLHQVRARAAGGGALLAADDLDAADLPVDRAWRVHFHVPIHRADVGEVATTRDYLRGALDVAARVRPAPAPTSRSRPTPGPCCRRPNGRATPSSLCAGIASELAWVERELPRVAEDRWSSCSTSSA